MKKERNNVFVIGLNMEDKSSEVIAREAAMKIVEITDELMERKRIHENKIKAIADEADLIVNGYAFLKKGDSIKVINLNHTENMAILDIDGSVKSTTMEEIEVDIVLDYYKRNCKFVI